DSETDTGDRDGVTCTVCPHPWDAHDRIGVRYCAATVAGALSRGCVCVGDTK
ncbi:MAG: RGCVC family protein, partial [Pseudonocardiaceae bacterium]